MVEIDKLPMLAVIHMRRLAWTIAGSVLLVLGCACAIPGGTTPDFVNLPDPSSPPGRPLEKVSVAERTSHSLTLNWWASSLSDGEDRPTFFELGRSTSELGDYSIVASVAFVASDTTFNEFVDRSLKPNSTYHYRVRACNDLGCSDWSSKVTAAVTEVSGDVNAPSEPAAWVTTGRNWEPTGVIWAPVSGATYYRLDARYSDDHWSSVEVNVPQTRYYFGTRAVGKSAELLEIVLLGGSPEGFREVNIQACNKAGCSASVATQGYLSVDVTITGVCEVGLRLNLGEGCHLEDNETLVYVYARNDRSNDICVKAGGATRCGFGLEEINEDLIVIDEDLMGTKEETASEQESGMGWVVRRHPFSSAPSLQAERGDPFQEGQVSFNSIAAGTWYTCGVRTDGSVTCWGDNDDGQATPPEGTFTSVSAGNDYTCGVKIDGSLACWGNDRFADLTTCYGSNGSRRCVAADWNGPATPPEGSFSAVTVGDKTACAVREGGAVACWGSDEHGQATPPEGTFTAVAVGFGHACGLKTDGTVACWGRNSFGQATPPKGVFTSISAGGLFTCGAKNDGSVACWGNNDDGRITPPAGVFTSISTRASYTCGVRTDGSVDCWGYNPYRDRSPHGIFTAVSVGTEHSCGVREGGTVACWGNNASGQATPP